MAEIKLVPVEPTREMIEAGQQAWIDTPSDDETLDDFRASYRAMLAASPQAPAREGETWSSMAKWTEVTFGPVSLERIATRANEEMQELLADPSDVMEAADVCIVLSRYPGIEDAINRKMAINRKREWRLNGDGSGYHVKAALTPREEAAAEGAGGICERLDAILVEEDRMHPIGCSTWEEETRVAIDMAKDALRNRTSEPEAGEAALDSFYGKGWAAMCSDAAAWVKPEHLSRLADQHDPQDSVHAWGTPPSSEFVPLYTHPSPATADNLLDALRDQSWDLRCFNMPTGGDDFDIGWRVVGHWQAAPCERTIAEVFSDNPAEAVRQALATLSPKEEGRE